MVRIRLRRKALWILLCALLLPLAWAGTVRADCRTYTGADAELIAQTVWGEARGCGQTQQAAVIWCILNRVDSDQFPNSIRGVITQKRQFAGYQPGNPVQPEILSLVYDVLSRWTIEQNCVAGVGRVLPESYLFFQGNGTENKFREHYSSTQIWDWSLSSPYEDQEISVEPQEDSEAFSLYPSKGNSIPAKWPRPNFLYGVRRK